ncbi:hypothetical protein FB45DRAFT_1003359 [Roridomyces roridus]|uniref:Uncharacterized protein n=1 Tax=Roridomyces roridus TaxID=1738132 RepID=A0AAD7FR68_9AGAR|nr:hypothetical protein FB45DRAFT_1003359 [Roridomyces roridus]
MSQLASSLLFSAISLIPHHASRYILLGFSAVFVVASAAYYQHPSAQLQNLEELIQQTEDTLREAHNEFPLNFRISLAGQGIRLLKYETPWKPYYCPGETDGIYDTLPLAGDPSLDVHSQEILYHFWGYPSLLFETERQHYYTADINETETMLAGFQVGRTGDFFSALEAPSGLQIREDSRGTGTRGYLHRGFNLTPPKLPPYPLPTTTCRLMFSGAQSFVISGGTFNVTAPPPLRLAQEPAEIFHRLHNIESRVRQMEMSVHGGAPGHHHDRDAESPDAVLFPPSSNIQLGTPTRRWL